MLHRCQYVILTDYFDDLVVCCVLCDAQLRPEMLSGIRRLFCLHLSCTCM